MKLLNKNLFLFCESVQSQSNAPNDSGIAQTDSQTGQGGNVVKVEGKRMKECIFLLVLGQLKTSAVFSYTWVKHMRCIHALTV